MISMFITAQGRIIMGYIIGIVVALLLGIWLIMSAFHALLTVLGWLLVAGAVVSLVMYFLRQRGGHTTAV